MTTVVSLELITSVAAFPASATVSTSPPIKRPLPEMVTRVPTCPSVGEIESMLAGAMYVHPPMRVTGEPVVLRTTTSPSPSVPRPATTSICSSLEEVIEVTDTPASVTSSISAPPSMDTPVMVTLVPACPAEGLTERISPKRRYVKPSSFVTVADVAAVRITSPRVSSPVKSPATRTTVVSLALSTVAGTPASVALLSSSAPDSRLVPVMITVAPEIPDDGATLVMEPVAKYVNSSESPDSTKAPVSAVSLMLPAVPSAAAPAITSTYELVCSCTSASTPASETATIRLPCPWSSLP